MFKVFCRIIAFFICILSGKANAQLVDSIKNHIDSSLYILKQHSLYAGHVDWKTVEQKVYAKAATAVTKAQTFAALTIAFKALGDKHAAYYQYDDAFKLSDSALVARYTDSIRAAWTKGPKVTNKMIGNIAYISIPFMGVNKQKDIDWYSNWVYDTIIKLSNNNPRAWVIDLRLNGGGNIRPMLTGLAPFFKDGIVSYYIDRNGKAMEPGSFKNGEFQIDGITQASLKNKKEIYIDTKVAVLIGAGTGSSGEGVAAVFKQRKNTKLFGEISAGRANATNGFVFDDNQSYYLISTAYLGDKNKKALLESVTPNVYVKNNDAFGNLLADNAVIAALKWLKQ